MSNDNVVHIKDSWGQKREMAFLERLGWHRIEGQVGSRYVGMPTRERQEMRVRCLAGYIKSLENRRHRWRSADLDALRKRARALLENAEKHLEATVRDAARGVR